MELVERVIEYSGDRVFSLYFVGDSHIGNLGHDRELWLHDLDVIANDPYALCIYTGDAVEAITPSDPRWDGEELPEEFFHSIGKLPHAQIKRFKSEISPIAEKIIGIHRGNHDNRFKREHYCPLIETVCEDLDVKCLYDVALTRLVFRHIGDKGERTRTYTLPVYSEHGSGGGASDGANLNKLMLKQADFEAKVYARGHCHRKGVWEAARLSIPSRGRLQLQEQIALFVLSGSYLRTYQQGANGYGQRASYKPTVLGCERVMIRPLVDQVYKS